MDRGDTVTGEFTCGDTGAGELIISILLFCAFVHLVLGATKAGKSRNANCGTVRSGYIAGGASSGFLLATLRVTGLSALGADEFALRFFKLFAFVFRDKTTVQFSLLSSG